MLSFTFVCLFSLSFVFSYVFRSEDRPGGGVGSYVPRAACGLHIILISP